MICWYISFLFCNSTKLIVNGKKIACIFRYDICCWCHLYVILKSAVVYFLLVSFVFPRRIVDHLGVTKFCWTLRALDLVFFQRWLSQISYVAHCHCFHTIIQCFSIFLFVNLFLFLAFEESRLTWEQDAGGYGRTEEIARWAAGCSIQVKP